MNNERKQKQAISLETYVLVIALTFILITFSTIMGADNFFNTLFNTAYYLLMNISFYLMAVVVLTSALSAIFAEFGVFALLNAIVQPVAKVIYRLPGVAAFGAISAYFSDNPAVISLAKEEEFRKRFKPYQIPALCNLGTSFGMGFIVTMYMITLQGEFGANGNITGGMGNAFVIAALVGLVASIFGSMVSVRLLAKASMKSFGIDKDPDPIIKIENKYDKRYVRDGGVSRRLLDAALDGGKNGVEIGLQIISGILIISTLVLMLTNGEPAGGYTGGIKEGIGFIPFVADYFMWLFKPLFGFTNSFALAFPLTSLGSAGAATGLVPAMLESGQIYIKDIAVFTAMGITWSGYLSTHSSMMDGLGARHLTGEAIVAHTIGGLCSGIAANYLFMLVAFLIDKF